ncbi:MAG: hypothetical protein FWG14_13610 [Peptococcaceae bacterium]|nr:hypothetical protein [Peptococcaceae bacterium]
MDSDTKLFSPRFSFLFITLPQVLLTMFFYYVYQSAGMIPTLPLIILFGIQATFNFYIALDAAQVIKRQIFHKYARIIQLVGFIAIMSAAIPLLIEQFNFISALAPETIYTVLCLIPLVYITTAILHFNEIPLIRIGIRIALCACFPLLIAFVTIVLSTINMIDLFSAFANMALAFLFALFFIFVCLLTSVLYHFRTRKSASSKILVQENEKIITSMAENPSLHKKTSSVGYYIFIGIVALLLPVFCLYLNNEIFRKVLGDFSSAWFYVLAIVNGIIMLAPRKNKWLTMGIFFLKLMGLLYVFYFVVLLLKYMPIAIAVFYFYLIPLLVLTPVVLFIAELFQIIDDFIFLKHHFKSIKNHL